MTTDKQQPQETGITPEDDAFLESLFSQARADTPEPSGDLMARILADAQEVQPAPARMPGVPSVESTAAEPSLVRRLLDAFGGWPALASMTTAMAAGIWIGVNPPVGVTTLTAELGLTETVIALPDSLSFVDSYLSEE